MGFPQLIPYCLTKFGVVGLCESLAAYVYDRGIGVSVVCPLLVATNIFERSWSYPEEEIPAQIEEQMRGLMRATMQAGLPPENVAADVVAAVKENRLYVLPHPELKAMVEAKWADPDAWVRNQAMSWRTQQEATRQLIGGSEAPSNR
jgi:short-subunit dehydrogenase